MLQIIEDLLGNVESSDSQKFFCKDTCIAGSHLQQSLRANPLIHAKHNSRMEGPASYSQAGRPQQAGERLGVTEKAQNP